MGTVTSMSYCYINGVFGMNVRFSLICTLSTYFNFILNNSTGPFPSHDWFFNISKIVLSHAEYLI